MVQISPVLAWAAVQLLGSTQAMRADDAQHVLFDPQEHSTEDVYKVKDE